MLRHKERRLKDGHLQWDRNDQSTDLNSLSKKEDSKGVKQL